MWLNEFFTDVPTDFEKRCRLRIRLSAGLIALGLISLGVTALTEGNMPILYLEPGAPDFVSGFYTGIGFGLIAAGLITIIKNRRYLKNGDLKKQRQIYETDERNRMLGLRSWAYTGYAMFLLLYIGVLVSGFISMTVMKVLLVVMAVYAILLFGFKQILMRYM